MAPDSLDDLASRRTWLEWKVLRQFREVFGEALTTMPDIDDVVAIDTRYVGEAALARRRPRGAGADREVHEHVPARDAQRPRRAHRVQRAQPVPPARRGAAGDARRRGTQRRWSTSPATSSTTRSSRTTCSLPFVTETVAYDLCALCEVASDLERRLPRPPARSLPRDRPGARDAGRRRPALRGVRKAQVKLASYYLLHERRARARAHLRRHGAASRPSACARSATRCSAITSKDFWEIVDRGTNFDYLSDERKAKLREFFSGFASLAAPAAE